MDNIVVPAISAAGGGLTVAWFAKLLLNNWLTKHNEMATAFQEMSKEVAKFQVYVGFFEKEKDTTARTSAKIHLIEERLVSLEKEMRDLAREVRKRGAI